MEQGQVIWFGNLRCRFLKVRKSDSKFVVALKSGAVMTASQEMFTKEPKARTP